MLLRKIPVSALLEPFVKNMWFLTVGEQDVPYTHQLFPFGSFELIVNLDNAPDMITQQAGGTFTQPMCFYSGQFTEAFTIHYTKPFKAVGATLHPWAGNLLFDIPARVFTNSVMPAEDIDPKLRLWEACASAASEAQIISALERFLLKRFKDAQLDVVASHIARSIMKMPTMDGIENIVAGYGLGRRRAEQRFAEATGLTMGQFVRKIRFQKVIAYVQQNDVSLTHLGITADYYDQSHFIREFKAFSGNTPTRFLKHGSAARQAFLALMD